MLPIIKLFTQLLMCTIKCQPGVTSDFIRATGCEWEFCLRRRGLRASIISVCGSSERGSGQFFGDFAIFPKRTQRRARKCLAALLDTRSITVAMESLRW